MSNQKGSDSAYPLKDIAVLVKRHNHDVRNVLNGMQAELSLLEHSHQDPETRSAIQRLRQVSSEIEWLMRGLGYKFGQECPTAVPALQIAERWNVDSRHLTHAVAIEWSTTFTQELVEVEPGLIRTLLFELLEIATRLYGRKPLRLVARAEHGLALFEAFPREETSHRAAMEEEQITWDALGKLAARNHAILQPGTLGLNAIPIRLAVPLLPNAQPI